MNKKTMYVQIERRVYLVILLRIDIQYLLKNNCHSNLFGWIPFGKANKFIRVAFVFEEILFYFICETIKFEIRWYLQFLTVQYFWPIQSKLLLLVISNYHWHSGGKYV